MLFADVLLLPKNAAGTGRYHRDAATEERADITCQSWDYNQVSMMEAHSASGIDQGPLGNQFAISLDDYLVDPPHAGDNGDDYRRLGELRLLCARYRPITNAVLPTLCNNACHLIRSSYAQSHSLE